MAKRSAQMQAMLRTIENECRYTGGLTGRYTLEQRVFDAMAAVPREEFVSPHLKPFAYDNNPLPIGNNQTISQPFIVALMTDLLEPKPESIILEIGTGSGYQAAVLSRICRKVYTIERIDALLVRARKVFDRLHYHNIISRIDDGTAGWPDEAPFDGILVTAGGPKIPEPLIEQLADPGRLVIPVGDQFLQELQLLEKTKGEIKVRTIEYVRFVNLIGTHGWSA